MGKVQFPQYPVEPIGNAYFEIFVVLSRKIMDSNKWWLVVQTIKAHFSAKFLYQARLFIRSVIIFRPK